MGVIVDSIFIKAEISRFEREGTELIIWVWSHFIVACLMLSVQVLIFYRFHVQRFESRFILPFFLATGSSPIEFLQLPFSQHRRAILACTFTIIKEAKLLRARPPLSWLEPIPHDKIVDNALSIPWAQLSV